MLIDLVHQLLESVERGRPVVYCRLVETRGSTPQKAGAAMLVWPDGSQFGTLGGGCVEAEVKRRSLAILSEGDAQIVKFQLDNDYGWDDGLICGGRMQVLVAPLRTPAELSYFRELARLCESGQGCQEAILFDDAASAGIAPAAFLFDAQGRTVASWPRSALPPERVIEALPELSARPRAQAAHGVAYLPSLERCTLVIVGGGHIGQAVGRWAPELGFDVWVVDDRTEYVTAERFPTAARRLSGEIGKVLPDLAITSDTYCLIVTRGHNHDEEALYHLVNRGARYVGMIGSKRKIKLIFDDLLNEGIAPDALAQVFAPVGIDIGSQTVPEIAVSILAELVAHRNRGGDVPGRPASLVSSDSL